MFISDLHLDTERPQIIERFLNFLSNDTRHAEAKEWPELKVADVQKLQQQRASDDKVTDEEAALILKVSGGHPRLLPYCLEQRRKNGVLNEQDYWNALVSSPVVYQLFTPHKREPEVVGKLCEMLKQSDLGPAEPYLSDDLLRRLYWKNLLRNSNKRLCWRCSALREAGNKILGCA